MFDETMLPLALKVAPMAHWLGLAWVYLYLLLIISLGGNSIGLGLCGLKLVKTDGKDPGSIRILIRWAILLIISIKWTDFSGSNGTFFMAAGFLAVLNLGMLLGRNGSGQLVHDGLSGTHIVGADDEYSYPLETNASVPLVLLMVVLFSLVSIPGYFVRLDADQLNEQLEKRLSQDKRIFSASVYDYSHDVLTLRVNSHIMNENGYIELEKDVVQIAFDYFEENGLEDELDDKSIEINVQSSLNFLVFSDYMHGAYRDRTKSSETWKVLLDKSSNKKQ